MPVTVEIIEGPLKGESFELKAGMKIGRSGSDLNLKDPKVSSAHAEIRMLTGSMNALILFDLGSTNGIKVKGKRVNSLELTPGTTFQIGNTTIKIVEIDVKGETAADLADWRTHLLRTVSMWSPTVKLRQKSAPLTPSSF